MNECKHHRGWISSGLLLGLVAFAVCGCSSHDEAIQFTEEPWSFRKISGTKLSTEHFDIHSTLRDHQLQQALPEFLEAAYDQYSTLLPPPASGEGKRLQTYVLNDRSQWDLYARTNFPGQYPVFRKISAGGFAV